MLTLRIALRAVNTPSTPAWLKATLLAWPKVVRSVLRAFALMQMWILVILSVLPPLRPPGHLRQVGERQVCDSNNCGLAVPKGPTGHYFCPKCKHNCDEQPRGAS
jgi:hypothetical protein